MGEHIKKISKLPKDVINITIKLTIEKEEQESFLKNLKKVGYSMW